ncbi:SRPBCC family protein [Mesobaculum littorinae]|uniref:SRPBCC family protein n=1 Tax=Mesobaculum littorinae TaxID=2486419 RepID=A0A438AEU3_9RHOB|nr:SRPBCC family protein [Mesobaculum littorinae]RVV97188.1 SRPBCC family protein [Mesobaculum littorinae]
MSSTSPKPDSATPLRTRLAIAFALAFFYGLLLYFAIWAGGTEQRSWIPFLAGLFLMPMAIASVATSIADPRGERPIWRHIRNGWLVIWALVAISLLFLGEGGICAVMAAPCFMAAAAAGSALTSAVLGHLRRRAGTTFAIALPLLPLLALPFEPMLSYADHHGAVTSVRVIDASPEDVWRHTVAVTDIKRGELPFSFSHDIVGAPRPESATLEGHGVGAVRHVRWSRGVRFDEVITDWERNRHLAWTFQFGEDAIPASVEAHIDVDSAYLKVATGEYTLDALPGGRTRLTLTTRYIIATPINAYCDFWGRIFLDDFHGAVLSVIKARAEKA